MEIIPAIDIIEGKCVRLTKGKFESKVVYSEDPVEVAIQWKTRGANRIHIVDLDGARMGKPVNKDIIKKIISTVDITVQVGGGIRSLDTIREYIESGARKIVLGSILFEDENFIKNIISDYQDNIIVSLDIKNEKIFIHGWERDTHIDYIEAGKKFKELGIQEFIYTNIDRDGTLGSPDLEGLKRFIELVNVRTIASGGISSMEDVKRIKETGASGVIIGKALYEGKINLEEAIKYAY